ncbi:MAG TPA: hypothetical protein VH392_01345 [Sphingomicrobium sp.]
MIDEIYDRSYRAGRDQLNAALLAGLTGLGRSVGNAFKVLNRIEYDAPWTARKSRLAR